MTRGLSERSGVPPTRALGLAAGIGGGAALVVLVLLRLLCSSVTGPICGGLAAGPPWLLLWLLAASPVLVVLWVHALRLRAAELELRAQGLAVEERRLLVAEQAAARDAQDLEQERASAAQRSDEHESRDATERFASGVALLGSDKVEARLGAIFALEMLAQDSDRFRPVVVDTLAAFVRQSAPLPLTRESASARQGDRLGEDVAVALGVLGRVPRPAQGPAHPVDLSCTNLRRASLAGGNYSGFNFKRSILRCAELDGADLRGANLSYAELSGDLRDVDVDKLERWDPRWAGASLRGADLRGADLSHADLRGARLNEAKLGLREAGDAGSGAELYSADLRWAELSRADLAGARLLAAKLANANLGEATLQRANLSRASLVDANLQRCNLSEANLSKADLSGARLRGVEGLLAKQLEAAASYARAEMDEALFKRLRERQPDAPGEGS